MNAVRRRCLVEEGCRDKGELCHSPERERRPPVSPATLVDGQQYEPVGDVRTGFDKSGAEILILNHLFGVIELRQENLLAQKTGEDHKRDGL